MDSGQSDSIRENLKRAIARQKPVCMIPDRRRRRVPAGAAREGQVRPSDAALAEDAERPSSQQKDAKCATPVFLRCALAARPFLRLATATPMPQVQRAVKDVNVIDESNLNDIMLTVGDPNESVAYFQGALAKGSRPGRPDARSGQIAGAAPTSRPKRPRSGEQIIASPEGTMDDKVMLADALDPLQPVGQGQGHAEHRSRPRTKPTTATGLRR